jgi:hypothetical protein
MDREAETLASENNHSASILMRAGAEKIREMAGSGEVATRLSPGGAIAAAAITPPPLPRK